MTDPQRKRIHVVLSETLTFSVGPLMTPAIIIFIINNVTDSYPEIQSWQCAYILSGFTLALIQIINLWWVDWRHYGDEEKNEQFWSALLLPFGFKSNQDGDTSLFTLPLLSLAPAIVGGYIANFILERTYSLDCDERYNPISTMCEDGVCCITVSNHENWFDFLPKLGGSIVTAWGVVKFIGTFVIKYGQFLDTEEDTKDAKETQNENDIPGGRSTTMNVEEQAH